VNPHRLPDDITNVAPTEDPQTLERIHRWQLGGASTCWTLITVAMYAISNDFFFLPDVVAIFAGACAVCTVILLVRPGTVFAYRFGGTLAEGTLFLLGASILLGLVHIKEPQLVWIVMAAVGLLTMLGFTYGNWWLNDLKRWHRAHRRGP
jgi:hypothetical protein